jgi:teichoic acid transport system ATP-binding protein
MPVTDSMIRERRMSSTAELAVSVQHVDIKYKVYEEQFFSAREMFARGLRSRQSTTVHAVKDVSFDVRVGEAVGIIGSNGSGKSTLLRAIGGLQSLSAGRILIRGESQLLGVSAALKPQLSGYRNVMLGGLSMGLDRDSIAGQMDEIVEFSGLGDAMGRPLKTYSSGMRARLAFSIATLRIPEVLLIDEALAVGDKDFREKSLQRLREIRDEAGTILLVTHNLNEIRQTCSRAIWLSDGVVRADGDVETVIDQYAGA